MKTVDEIMAKEFPVQGVRSFAYKLGCRHALDRELSNGSPALCPFPIGSAENDAYHYGCEHGVLLAWELEEAEQSK